MPKLKDKLGKYIWNLGLKYFIKSWIKDTKELLLVTNNKGLYISNLNKIYNCCKDADSKINNGEEVLQSLFTDRCCICKSPVDIKIGYTQDLISDLVDKLNKGNFICDSCERDNKINSIIN